jgi:hypothetical protein
MKTTQPPIQWLPDALSPPLKWLWHEADQPQASRAKVKNEWNYLSTPHVPSWHAKGDLHLWQNLVLHNVAGGSAQLLLGCEELRSQTYS